MRGIHGERTEREHITGVWRRSPQRGPGAEPLLGEAESFSVLIRRKDIANLPFSCVLGSGYVRAAGRSAEKGEGGRPDRPPLGTDL